MSCFSADIDEVLSEVSSLASRVQDADSAGQFEWVDSVLVTALKYGHWLCITNANFCRSGPALYRVHCENTTSVTGSLYRVYAYYTYI